MDKLSQLKKWPWQRIKQGVYGLLLILIVLVAGVTATALFELPGGARFYTVQSGSMEPTIGTGSLVVVSPQDAYAVGDIITFHSTSSPEVDPDAVSVTHRIIAVQTLEDGRKGFVTQGDANDVKDSVVITPDMVVGRVVFWLPLIGYPVALARTLPGLMLLIVIPATIIVWSELMSIKREVFALVRRRRQQTVHKLSASSELALEMGQSMAPPSSGSARASESGSEEKTSSSRRRRRRRKSRR